MLAVVVSEADEASVRIGAQLRAVADWTERTDTDRPAAEGGGTYWTTDGASLRTVETLHLECEGVADAFGAAAGESEPTHLAFVSRHSGETGPLLSAHFTGNLGPAEFGGATGRLAAAAPGAGDAALAALRRHAPADYDVAMECTHHGPSEVGCPSLFVELGSGPDQWRDDEAARAVARATLALRDVAPRPERTVACVGGGHYAPRATRLAEATDWAVGHVAADWALEAAGGSEVDGAVLDQLLARSGADRVVVEDDHGRLADRLAERGHEVVSETWLRESEGIPADRLRALEAQLSPVDEGLRTGAAATAVETGGWTVREPDPELLAACQGADRAATLAAVADHTVAYETTEAGQRVTGRVAVADAAAWEALLAALVDVLAATHEDARLEPDAVVLVEEVFDPETARERGVPEGPAFGRLADGADVEVDGETVTAASVHTRRTRRFPR